MATTYLIAGRADSGRVRRTSFFYALERPMALALFALVMPLCALLAAVIAVLSRRPPLVAHLRVGRDGSPLWMLKFRTMWERNAGGWRRGWVERIAESPAEIKVGHDPRVTSRFAAFCRRHSLDELPQLFHVLRGDMSLVGPRPVTAAELKIHYGHRAAEVLSLRPGITGLWQVMGRSRLSYRQRRRLDLFLVRHYSPRLCSLVLLRTIPRALSGKNAW